MKPFARITLTVLLMVPSVRTCFATTTICETGAQSEMQLVVLVPESSYSSFVRLIESGELAPPKKPLKYNGGVESDRSKWWGLNNQTFTVSVSARYVKKSKQFEFWVQTCNTKESWRPYWRALTERVRAFPGAKLHEERLKNE